MLYGCTTKLGAHLFGSFLIVSLLTMTGTRGEAPDSVSSSGPICAAEQSVARIPPCADRTSVPGATCTCCPREKGTTRGRKPGVSAAPPCDNGSKSKTLDVWQAQRLGPCMLTRDQYIRRLTIVSAFHGCAGLRKAPHCEALLADLSGRQQSEEVQALLRILGVERLPSAPKVPMIRLAEEQLRSVDEFIISSALENRPQALNPDRVAYTHALTGERVKVHIIYGKSPADALRRLIESAWMIGSAPLFHILPTSRSNQGPGDFCWLGWTPTNRHRTQYIPSEADVLFIRNGVAVLLRAEDASRHQSVIDLATKLDELLVDCYEQHAQGAQSVDDQ